MRVAPALPEPRTPGRYAVTFVCTGNICRSPMADVVTRRLAEERGLTGLDVTSSGTGDWHVGAGADPRTVDALERRGYDGRPHRAAAFDASLFADYDLVIGLDGGHLDALRALAPDAAAHDRIRLLRDFDPEAEGAADVPDPYWSGPDEFDRVLAMVERSCTVLVDALTPVLPAR